MPKTPKTDPDRSSYEPVDGEDNETVTSAPEGLEHPGPDVRESEEEADARSQRINEYGDKPVDER